MFGSNYFGRPYFAQGYAAVPGAIEELSGTIAAQSGLSGTLVRDRSLLGSIAGVSTLSGLLTRERSLSGLINGQSTFDGVLTVGAEIYLQGSIDAQSSISAALNVLMALQGTIDGQSSLSGDLSAIYGLGGTIEAVSSVSGNLAVLFSLSGTIAARAYLVAILSTTIAEPWRPPIGLAFGPKSLVAVSRLVEGLAAQGIITAPILPGRGKESLTPLGSGRVTHLSSGLASGQGIPRPGSAGIVKEVPVGHGKNHVVPPGKGIVVEAVVRNLDENPSFETDIVGVSVIEGTVAQATTKAKYGTYSCRAERAAGWMRVLKKRLDGSMYPVVPGDVYIHSVSAQMETGDTGFVAVGLLWYDADEVYISLTYDTYVLSDSAWTEAQHIYAAPANAAFVVLEIDAWAMFDPGDSVYLDGQELRHEPAYAEPYIDGDQNGCDWVGIPHASASYRSSALSPPWGKAKGHRTREGEAETDRPPESGKAR